MNKKAKIIHRNDFGFLNMLKTVLAN